MKFPIAIASAVITVLAQLPIGPALAHDIVVKPYATQRFAKLPHDVAFPEGIAANPNTGDIYVGTFVFGPGNVLLRYSHRGRLLARKDFGTTPLLGLAYNPTDDKVYIANFGASQIQRIESDFDAFSVVETVASVPMIGAPAPRIENNNPDGSEDMIVFGSISFPAPNALTFDSLGNLYLSDSFQGAIFHISSTHLCGDPAPDCLVDWTVHDPLLATAGFPPFGANGVALNKEETLLYIANTGDDRILRLDLSTHMVDVAAESIAGADGLAVDDAGRLWVVANQGDYVAVLDAKFKVIAKLGQFLGIRSDGSPRGLSFPASIVLLGHGAYVTNLSLPLTGAIGDEHEEDVTRYTVSRFDVHVVH